MNNEISGNLLLRICKQCGKKTMETLKIGKLHYLFCSRECREAWNAAREEERKARREFSKLRSWEEE